MEGLPAGYRPNVGVCLINSENQVFVASRLNVPGAWQMPQVSHWLTYDFPPAVKAKVNRLWGGEWHGQAQKWFLMRLTGDDNEVNLANGEVDPEFSEWKWASPEEVIEQAVDYKRPTYEEVLRTFMPYFNGKETA
ncbi:PREDICTED: nudix hydrolase 25 isoform X2 [Nelumbo nucifera]|uniref:Nudix hydrolase 25 isoform X2 n=1 Tax=Nelumbo nucifera TaxID=4432 RepID=A0A1U8B5H7_NELNU|nr:PREDICTED: nudix hydrolase 25 isoform X2 [Nelumbo nucifera]